MVKVLYKTITSRQQIIVTNTGISSPPSNTMGQNIMIKYSSIKRIFLHSIDSHMSIVILHNNERLIISETLLRDRNTFIALTRSLDKKITVENFSEG
jgi:small nuclear ribonucleoprotein (snRNP)-like protein